MNRQEIIDYCLSLPLAYEDYPFDNRSYALIKPNRLF